MIRPLHKIAVSPRRCHASPASSSAWI
jgi:hypothetical protein